MKNNYLFVIEGVDRSGKDTIAVEVGKRTDFKIPFIIRGPCGYDVYNQLHNKGFDSSEYEDLAKKLDEFTITIFLDCDESIIEKRFIETNEEPLRGGLSVNDNIEKYREVFAHYKNDLNLKNFYTIKNNKDVNLVIDNIVKIIKEVAI